MVDALRIHGVGGPTVVGPGTVTYDRRGYGDNPGPEGYAATTVEEQSEDAARLLAALDAAPLTVIGDDFGALVALDLALRHPELVAALALHDPVVAQFVPDSASAVAHWLGRGSGPGFYADLAAATRWQVTRRELRAITVPTEITVTAGAPAAVTASADGLASLLPQAQRVP